MTRPRSLTWSAFSASRQRICNRPTTSWPTPQVPEHLVMNYLPRPRQHLITVGARYEGAWLAYDQFRAGRGKDLPDWPDWCFAPMAAAYAIVSGGGDNRVSPAQVGDIARVAALAAWRPTQGIFRFDPALYGALIQTTLTGDLPCEVLFRLPAWCVYIETPGREWMGSELHGFFAHMERDVGTGRDELRLLMDSRAGLLPVPIHLGPWPLSEAVSRAIDLSRAHATVIGAPMPDGVDGVLADGVAPLLSLLLYLCADEAEIGDGTRHPTMPKPKRTNKGWRHFPPDAPSVWDVGVRIGAALRRAYHASETGQGTIDQATGRARPRAHVRNAHWHTFLAGHGRTERKLKWLPPIPVNIGDIDTLPTTVRPVR